MGHSLSAVHFFLSGAVAFGSWAAGVFFFRFWAKTRDRLFLLFGCAFWLFALGRLVSVFYHNPDADAEPALYLIRLTAFILIIVAVVDKNRYSK